MTQQAGSQIVPNAAAPRFSETVVKSGLSLVLPAYNEAAVIAHSIREAVDALDWLNIRYEVIVVDDGSRDETAEIARSVAAGYSQVRVISLGRNVGYGAALRAGFQAASHELVAFTDADGQFNLRDLAVLLARVDDADVVCGYRVDRQDHWTRKLYSRGYNVIVRALLGTRVRDCDCALKIFRRDQILQLDLQSNGFFINGEILTKLRLAGLSVVEAGVRHFPRVRGESKVSISHIPPVLQTLIRFWWSHVMFPARAERPESSVPLATYVWQGALLVLAACLLILPNLSYPLIDPDESRYAEIAREMLESGDYVVPTRLAEPYLDKPPLLYWLTATSFRFFGVSVAAARLVPALAALATIAVVFVLGAKLVGRRAAWLAGLTMLATCGFLLSARFVFIDTLLMFLTTSITLTGFLACRDAKISWRWWLASAMTCGLGILAKGPIAVVLCVPPLIVARWLSSLPRLTVRQVVGYAFAAALVALPWFVMIENRQPGFIVEFLWKHHFDRFRTGLTHAEPWWFYVAVLLVGMAPASILFPAITTFLLDSGRTTRTWRSWSLGATILATLWILVVYSCSTCKLAPYMLPIVPLICIVTGVGLEAIIAGKVDHPFLLFVRQKSPQHIVTILTLAAVITAAVDLFGLDGVAAGRTWHWIGLIAVCALATIVGLRQRSPLSIGRWGMATVAAFCALAMGMLDFYPGVATARSKVEPIVEKFEHQLDAQAPIVCFGLTNEADSLAFHLPVSGRVQNYDAFHPAEAAHAIIESPEVVVLSHVDNHESLVSQLPEGVVIEQIARHEYIFVGICTTRPRLAQRP